MKRLFLCAAFLLAATAAHAQSGLGFAVGPSLATGDQLYDTGYHAQVLLDGDLPSQFAGLRLSITYQKFRGPDAETSFFDDEYAIGAQVRLGWPPIPLYVIGGPSFHIRTFEAFGIEGLPNTEIETDFGVSGGVGALLRLPDLPRLFAEVRVQTVFRNAGELDTTISYVPISVGIIF